MEKHWQFKKGNTGKPKGAKSKISKTVKETVLAVFNDLQEDPESCLLEFAKKNNVEFYKIAAKLIPTEVKGTIDTTVTWNETKKYLSE